MSRQETRIGKIKPTGLCLTDWMFDNRHLVMDSYKEQDDLYEIFFNGLTCGYDKFVLLGGEVFEVVQDKEYEDYEILEVTPNVDGTYSYVLSYYNGGCGFSEALACAWENMNE